MQYLLDTCVLSDFVRGNANTIQKIKSLSPNNFCLSAITIVEMQYSILRLHSSKKAIAVKTVTDEFINNRSDTHFPSMLSSFSRSNNTASYISPPPRSTTHNTQRAHVR